MVRLAIISASMLLLAVSGQTEAQTPAPIPESPGAFGYPSVAAAREALRSHSGVVFDVQNGWDIATDDGTRTIWSFAPPDYPAYPAAVKRQLVESGEGVTLEMSVLCQASKEACDDLVREFMQLNENAMNEARAAAGR